jgi:hypothetical protein
VVTPFALFFLVGAVVARNSGYLGELGGSLFKLSLTLGLALVVHAFIVIPLLLKFMGGRSPIEYFRNVFPALFTAYATASPSAALAVTYENSLARNKLDSRSAALVLPLGTSLNVDGRAMYVVISAIFIAQIYGVELGITGMLYLAATVFLFSLGTATVPFAGMLTLALVFDAIGFPNGAYAGIGLIFAVDWFWGRKFAALDVWSDTAVAAAVEEVTSTASFQKKVRRTERSVADRARRTPRDSRPIQKRGERKRVASRRDSRSSERPKRPFGKSDQRPAPRGRQRQTAPSPFELKPEKSRAFDPETANARERAPYEIARKEEESTSESARRMRGKRISGTKEKKEAAAKKPTPVSEPSETKEPVSPPRAAAAPPPLIRELEPVEKESTVEADAVTPESPEPIAESIPVTAESPEPIAEPKPVKPKRPKPKAKAEPKPAREDIVETEPEVAEVSEPAPEPKQTETPEPETPQPERFGRSSRRKGPRPKTDATPAPASELPEFPTEKLEFGRKSRKKNKT